MLGILIKAGCYVGIIVLGWLLRKMGFFKEADFYILSKVAIKITLPAAIVYSFAGKEFDLTLLSLAFIALGGGICYMALGALLGRKGGREQQAFTMLNLAGYNIGNFTLPFVQGFLGPMGVIATSLFDIGNCPVCLSGAYSVAAMVKDGSRFSVKRILISMSRSPAIVCYAVMILLRLTHVPIPGAVVSYAEIIANANAFVAMLMLGVGFKLSGDWQQLGRVAQILLVRYALAAVIGAGCYLLLPFELEVRQALVILAFSPIASAAPGFTAELKSDTGLASAVNSISIVVSIVIIVALLLVML